jgi:hypothetical protein
MPDSAASDAVTISISEIPKKTIMAVLGALVGKLTPHDGESVQSNGVDCAVGESSLWDKFMELVGENALVGDFRQSLDTFSDRYEAGSSYTQLAVAEGGQTGLADPADTSTVCLSRDHQRMRTTYQRFTMAATDVILVRHVQELLDVSEAHERDAWSREGGQTQNIAIHYAVVEAVNGSLELQRLYGTKLAAATRGAGDTEAPL